MAHGKPCDPRLWLATIQTNDEFMLMNEASRIAARAKARSAQSFRPEEEALAG